MKQGEKDVMTKEEILQSKYHNICIIITKHLFCFTLYMPYMDKDVAQLLFQALLKYKRFQSSVVSYIFVP